MSCLLSRLAFSLRPAAIESDLSSSSFSYTARRSLILTVLALVRGHQQLVELRSQQVELVIQLRVFSRLSVGLHTR